LKSKIFLGSAVSARARIGFASFAPSAARRRRAARSVDAMLSRTGFSTDFVNHGEQWLPPESTSRDRVAPLPGLLRPRSQQCATRA